MRPIVLDPGELEAPAAAMLAAGALLPLVPGDGVSCPLRSLTGIPCPLCGMTTSVVETVRLDLTDALAANPAGVAAVVAALAVLALRPRRIRVPALAVSLALAGMWLWELERFAVL